MNQRSLPHAPARRSLPAATYAIPQRVLGLLDAVGIGFGVIIGAGIFVVMGVAAGVAGPALLIGLAVAGVAATANALNSAQLALRDQCRGHARTGHRLRALQEPLGTGLGVT